MDKEKKKEEARKIRKELDFWNNIRKRYGEPPTQNEFDLEDKLADLENRNEFGIERW